MSSRLFETVTEASIFAFHLTWSFQPSGQPQRRPDSCQDFNYWCMPFLPELVHGQVTIIFVVSVGLSVCLFVCAEFFLAVFDPISIKLGHMLYVWL